MADSHTPCPSCGTEVDIDQFLDDRALKHVCAWLNEKYPKVPALMFRGVSLNKFSAPDLVRIAARAVRQSERGSFISDIAIDGKLMDLTLDLIKLYDMASGGKPLMSNQGQALDGFSELANYRDIIKRIKAVYEGPADDA